MSAQIDEALRATLHISVERAHCCPLERGFPGRLSARPKIKSSVRLISLLGSAEQDIEHNKPLINHRKVDWKCRDSVVKEGQRRSVANSHSKKWESCTLTDDRCPESQRGLSPICLSRFLRLRCNMDRTLIRDHVAQSLIDVICPTTVSHASRVSTVYGQGDACQIATGV